MKKKSSKYETRSKPVSSRLSPEVKAIMFTVIKENPVKRNSSDWIKQIITAIVDNDFKSYELIFRQFQEAHKKISPQ